jgi:hypothetical protein
MTPEEIKAFCDSPMVRKNPWRLPPKQCLALHLICKYGMRKAASIETGISELAIHFNITAARKKLKLTGSDVRAYLLWNQYEREFQ